METTPWYAVLLAYGDIFLDVKTLVITSFRLLSGPHELRLDATVIVWQQLFRRARALAVTKPEQTPQRVKHLIYTALCECK